MTQEQIYQLIASLKALVAKIQAYIASQPAVIPTPTPPISPVVPSMPLASPFLWDTPESSRHSLRMICDEEGLTLAQKNLMSQVIHCESDYRNDIVHPNILNGATISTDYGICQINDHYHIGPGKDFPSVEYVMSNPEKIVRWMCKMVKAGKINLWVCFSSKLYLQYEP